MNITRTLHLLAACAFFVVVSSCTITTSASAQDADFPLTGSPFASPFSTDPTRPTIPLNPGPSGRYDIPESQPEYNDRNEWSSGQRHVPSNQWTPPAPSSHDFNVWQRGQLKTTCTSDSKGNIYCL